MCFTDAQCISDTGSKLKVVQRTYHTQRKWAIIAEFFNDTIATVFICITWHRFFLSFSVFKEMAIEKMNFNWIIKYQSIWPKLRSSVIVDMIWHVSASLIVESLAYKADAVQTPKTKMDQTKCPLVWNRRILVLSSCVKRDRTIKMKLSVYETDCLNNQEFEKLRVGLHLLLLVTVRKHDQSLVIM